MSGSRAERYQVVLHVDEGMLRSHLDDGTRVSAETSRRLTCDAAVVRVRHGTGGTAGGGATSGNGSPPLDIGRRTRTVSPALRRALELRDGGCRFPGCGLRFTDAHHVRHWADGGQTSLENLVLLCRRHHRAVHQEGFRVAMGPPGRPAFFDPRGLPLPDTPPPLAAPLAGTAGGAVRADAQDPADALVRAHRARGVRPDWRTASARWRRESDIPQGVLERTLEALEHGGAGAGSM